jgi:Tol biopolymer transport system component
LSDSLLSRKAAPRLVALVGIFTALLLLAGAHAAHAAFPGANGKITFDRYTALLLTESPAATRDGKALARHVSTRLPLPQVDQVWTINPDGSAASNVSNNSALDEYGNWSADGAKIAFDDWSSFVDPQVSSMNADGSAQTDLTNNTALSDSTAAWSPDGTRIVYAHVNPTTKVSEIWVMNADGSNQHLLVTPAEGLGDFNPNWSPDGTRVAFSRQDTEADTAQIYVANADGSGTPQNVSNNSDYDEDPNWSPDGTRLVFDKYVNDDGDAQIWVMNADGSAPHLVLATDGVDDEAAAWSPDGTQIAYERSADRAREIWVVAADGSGDHQVSAPPLPYEDYEPDWQPVGAPASAAALAACTPTGSAVVHASDATGFLSPLNVHFRVDGGGEQVAPVDGAGNVAIPLSGGSHAIEYWAGDAVGYQEAAHHTATTTVDTVTHCAPAGPAKVSVAGVRRACVSKAFNVRVRITTAAAPKSVRVFLGKKRILTTTKRSFSLHINPKKLARHTRLRIVAVDASGKTTTLSRTIARCAVAKPKHKSAPRFTG